jgi:hypothetical protein
VDEQGALKPVVRRRTLHPDSRSPLPQAEESGGPAVRVDHAAEYRRHARALGNRAVTAGRGPGRMLEADARRTARARAPATGWQPATLVRGGPRGRQPSVAYLPHRTLPD